MADDKVLPFPQRPSPQARRREKARGKTLCGRGFHKWQVEGASPFDVKQGRLMTLRRCSRCGVTRTSAD
ncbi:MAG: hypothetical protein R3E82_13010 [Pseudomonadales bacterium]|nr:hypothetical protein [Pseudomonadales bacterium]